MSLGLSFCTQNTKELWLRRANGLHDKLILTCWIMAMCRREPCPNGLATSAMIPPGQVLAPPTWSENYDCSQHWWSVIYDTLTVVLHLQADRHEKTPLWDSHVMPSQKPTEELSARLPTSRWFTLIYPSLAEMAVTQTGFSSKATNPAHFPAWWKDKSPGG